MPMLIQHEVLLLLLKRPLPLLSVCLLERQREAREQEVEDAVAGNKRELREALDGREVDVRVAVRERRLERLQKRVETAQDERANSAIGRRVFEEGRVHYAPQSDERVAPRRDLRVAHLTQKALEQLRIRRSGRRFRRFRRSRSVRLLMLSERSAGPNNCVRQERSAQCSRELLSGRIRMVQREVEQQGLELLRQAPERLVRESARVTRRRSCKVRRSDRLRVEQKSEKCEQ